MQKRIKLGQAEIGDVIAFPGDLVAFGQAVVVKKQADGIVQLARPYAQVVAADSTHPYALTGLEQFPVVGTREVYLVGHSPTMQHTLTS